MKTILNISLICSLLGITGLSIYSGDSHRSVSTESESTYIASSISTEQAAEFSLADYPVLFNAKSFPDVPSEIDPRTSISADWTSSKNKNSTQLQYLIRASLFELSQSVRNLIFPFHSYL